MVKNKVYIHYKTKKQYPFSEYAYSPYVPNTLKDLPLDGFPYIIKTIKWFEL